MIGVMKTEIGVDPEMQAFMHSLHDKRPIVDSDQSLFNGTTGYIDHMAYDTPIRKIIERMDKGITSLIGSGWSYVGVWSNRLKKGGYHTSHIHPRGDMSGVYYMDVPDTASGTVEFIDGDLQPRTGDLIMFPSDKLHGVTIYLGDDPRLTVAFDVVKHDA